MVSHETQTPNNPESPFYSSEQISKALDTAVGVITRYTADPHLQARCMEIGLDPIEDCETPGYWRLFGSFMTEKMARAREEYGDNPQIDAIDLMASSPSHLYDDGILKSEHPATKDAVEMKKRVIEYNHRIELFARKYPETAVDKLQLAMQNMFIKACNGESVSLRRSADQRLHDILVGLQHELGFEQILDASGRQYRHGDKEEDGNGIDYVIDNRSFNPLYVDVKSTVEGLDRRNGSNRPFVVRGPSHVNMISLILHTDFHNRFFIDPGLAAEKAPSLNAMIDQAKKIAG